MRMASPAECKLNISLRFLATGDSFASLQYLFRILKYSIRIGCDLQRFGFFKDMFKTVKNSFKNIYLTFLGARYKIKIKKWDEIEKCFNKNGISQDALEQLTESMWLFVLQYGSEYFNHKELIYIILMASGVVTG